MAKNIVIYSTFPTQELAESVASELLKQKLIACANIGSNIISLYEWEGKLEKSSEIPAIFKTSEKNYAEIEQLIKKMHPYEVPCVISLAIADGYPPFLKWIETLVK